MTSNSIGIIDDIMSNDMVKWIEKKIQDLPKPIQYRAYSAIRALEWSNRIFAIDLPIPAAFSALHATEEAVAAFIRCAKHYNYGDDAKINVKDHQQKATISFLATMVINSLNEFKPGIALNKEQDFIALKIMDNGQIQYSPASLYRFRFGDANSGIVDEHFLNDVMEKYGDIQKIKEEIINIQNARNKIFYSDDDGYPSGFSEPKNEIRNECKKTLALLWACIDIHENKETKIPLIEQALRTAQIVIEGLKKKKCG